jgi:hypothetical protein
MMSLGTKSPSFIVLWRRGLIQQRLRESISVTLRRISCCIRNCRAPQAGPVASPRQRMLTKGDNNHVDDLELYNGLDWLESQHIVGVVKG